MKITRKSILSGVTRTREIDITEAQLEQWKAGKHLRWLIPHVSMDDREFLISGATADEWAESFPEVGEDE